LVFHLRFKHNVGFEAIHSSHEGGEFEWINEIGMCGEERRFRSFPPALGLRSRSMHSRISVRGDEK
jgi:hypothetical protein